VWNEFKIAEMETEEETEDESKRKCEEVLS